MISLPESVKIVEVGPRDGLQNEQLVLDASVRVEFINRLVDSGLKVVEAGSFVSPARVPQMNGTETVLAGLQPQMGVSYPVLVPNIRGLTAALVAGANEIAVITAASESFSQRNVNCSIAQSLKNIESVCETAIAYCLKIRAYVSCVLDCPFEGRIDSLRVADLANCLLEMGCYEVSLGETLGMGTPGRFQALLVEVARKVSLDCIAMHCHDTYGQALVNIFAGLEFGVSIFDSSVAGLGGCPYAPGAAGNVASEDLIFMLDGLGIQTGVDLGVLTDAGQFICGALGIQSSSRAGRALAHEKPRRMMN